MRALLLAFLLSGCLTTASFSMTTLTALSSDDEEAITLVVEAIFDAMYAGDAEALHALFHPEAELRIVDGDGLTRRSAESFIAQVGIPREDPLDERFTDLEIRIDGPLAAAWMAYTMYIGDDFSHCGVNAMEFVRTDDGWQVLGISYTRRTADCPAEL